MQVCQIKLKTLQGFTLAFAFIVKVTILREKRLIFQLLFCRLCMLDPYLNIFIFFYRELLLITWTDRVLQTISLTFTKDHNWLNQITFCVAYSPFTIRPKDCFLYFLMNIYKNMLAVKLENDFEKHHTICYWNKSTLFWREYSFFYNMSLSQHAESMVIFNDANCEHKTGFKYCWYNIVQVTGKCLQLNLVLRGCKFFPLYIMFDKYW